ncbi:hypothetical protein GF337_14750 [candidate division KSB1 bacterium]|nr:hypothetical protein [candidate division KSB1 bacterium]
MINVIYVMLAIAVTIIFIAYLFHPKKGLIYRIQRVRQNIQRRFIEDALKHNYHCETQQLACTIQSLAGALSFNIDRTTKLISRLEELSLIKLNGKGLHLTSQGRRYALGIIRTHRLWELYLANETGIDEIEWHSIAEIEEHKLTEDEMDKIAEIMRYPRFDPHGAPIPTKTGEIPPKKTIPMTELNVGDYARIVSVEDEPKTIYAQITALGLCQGMEIHILEHTPQKIRFAAEGDESVLAPLIAANINVNLLQRKPHIRTSKYTLADLDPGKQGTVIGISTRIRGQQRRRLMDIGIIPGTLIASQIRSPGGDPTAYEIRGALIALRRKQARQIYIDPKKKTGDQR